MANREKLQVGEAVTFKNNSNLKEIEPPHVSTIIEIRPKPSDTEEAKAELGRIIAKLIPDTQSVIDGKNLLDYKTIAERVDPNVFYIFEQ